MRPLRSAIAGTLALLVGTPVLLTATPARAAGNQPPVAVDDALTYRNTGGVDYLVPALANDTDPEGDPLTYTAVGPATKGTTSLQNGKLYYHPTLGMTGTDSFTYTITDGQGNTATATVTATLWVDPPPPTGTAISIPSPGSVTLTWSASAGATQYRVYRNGDLVSTTSALTWTDTGVREDLNWGWTITGVNAGGFEGRPSTYDLVQFGQRPAPTGLAVHVTNDPTSLSLAWVSGWVGATYVVYRDGVRVGTTAQQTYTDTGLVTGHQYSYQVQVDGTSDRWSVTPPSPMSAVAVGTPVALSPIDVVFWNLGADGGTLGPVTVAERAIPGGRQQDHRNGVILQQDGEDAHALVGAFATQYVVGGGVDGLGFPVADEQCGFMNQGCAQLLEGGGIWSSSDTGTWVVPQEMEDGFTAAGGLGHLGYPVGNEVSVGHGLAQPFQDGAVYWSPDTGSHAVMSWIWDRWADTGYETGSLGYPTSDQIWTPIGTRQAFQNGTISWSMSFGARAVRGALADAWNRSGWESGPLGYVVSEEIPLRGGSGQVFSGGAIYWSPTTSAHSVHAAIQGRWAAAGYENGALGYPTSDEIPLNGGTGQTFQGGTIWWSASGGAHLVGGALKDGWARSGWEGGPLGYPTSEQVALRGGTAQVFSGGTLYWSPATGAHPVSGAIRDAWARSGWENGPLGYPTSDVISLNGGTGQTFQGGTIWWSASGGAHLVGGALKDAWARSGWEGGPLGYPTSEQVALRGGTAQVFSGGTLYWSPASGAHWIRGALRDAWARSGWENGPLGYPTADEIPLTGGSGQTFQGGTIWSSPSGGAHLVGGVLKDAWARSGWENGPLGYPTSDQVPLNGGTGQVFSGGTLYWSPASGAHAVRGAIRDVWAGQGWEGGRLGYPSSDETVSGGTRRQDFQGGSIDIDSAGRSSVTYTG